MAERWMGFPIHTGEFEEAFPEPPTANISAKLTLVLVPLQLESKLAPMYILSEALQSTNVIVPPSKISEDPSARYKRLFPDTKSRVAPALTISFIGPKQLSRNSASIFKLIDVVPSPRYKIPLHELSEPLPQAKVLAFVVVFVVSFTEEIKFFHYYIFKKCICSSF